MGYNKAGSNPALLFCTMTVLLRYQTILTILVTAVFGFSIVLSTPQISHAQQTPGPAEKGNYGLKDLGASSPDLPFVSEDDANEKLPLIVGNIFRVLLSILGLIFLILIVYGGMRWMLARGDSGDVELAKEILTDAFIGLIIVVASYAIVNFIFSELINNLDKVQ